MLLLIINQIVTGQELKYDPLSKYVLANHTHTHTEALWTTNLILAGAGITVIVNGLKDKRLLLDYLI